MGEDDESPRHRPTSQTVYRGTRGTTSAGIVPDTGEVTLPEEELPFGNNWFGALIAQCCSMRDRNRDALAAKMASQTGRPPPPPPVANAERQLAQTQKFQPHLSTAPPISNEHAPPISNAHAPPIQYTKAHSETDSDSDAVCWPPKGSPPPQLPKYTRTPSESSSSGEVPEQRIAGMSNTFPYSKSRDIPEEQLGKPSVAPRESGRFIIGSDGALELSASRDQMVKPSLNSPPLTQASVGQLDHWEWPPWCLRQKDPCIEVFVEDEDTGDNRWVPAEPQNRVVDPSGKDTFLCAEYEWDGELYNQDFGPQHVRRRGDTRTVKELLAKAAKPFDSGGGVRALLGI